MISEEAVEAAAKCVVEQLTANELGWVDADELSDTVIDVRDFDMRAAMRAALEAAAPHLTERAYNAGHLDGMTGAPNTNPYRSQA